MKQRHPTYVYDRHSKLLMMFYSSQETAIHEKAKKLLSEMKQSMDKNEQNFGRTELDNLRSIAEELENHTCKHVMRYIFQESMEIERYPQIFRERFDIAFSQAVILLSQSSSVDQHSSVILSFLVNLFDIFYQCPTIVCENQ